MKLKAIIPVLVVLFAIVYVLYLRSDTVQASLVLTNGVVYTVDDELPMAEAVAISGDRIIGVGSSEEIGKRFRSDNIIDLDGKPVFPGFIDSHAHIENLGVFLLNVDLVGTTSIAEIQSRLRPRAEGLMPGAWIRGRGWDQNDWAEKRFPQKGDLDLISSEVPIYLNRVDGHAVWVNSKVLEIAGIDRETPDPPGGRIVRDAHGEPTGIFVDNAVDMLDTVLPEPTREERTEAILTAIQSCSRLGLTGVHDMGVELEEIEIYRELIAGGRFPLRVYAAIGGNNNAWKKYRDTGPEIGTGNGRLTVRALKLYADGALGSYGAALIEPYSDDPGNRGLTLTSTDSIRILGEEALKAGFQLAVHAIGDRANNFTLNIYEDLYAASPTDPTGLRFRIEHVQVLDRSDIPRFAKLGVIPAMQPTHCTSDMYWAETRLGPERIRGCYAWRSIIDAGSMIPGGSDFPVESNNPLWGFYAAVTRQDHQAWPEGGWYAEERMTREEALKSFTLWGAYASFEEEIKGSIRKGKYADLVVLSDDIMTISSQEILRTTVAMTILAGEAVYSSGSIAASSFPFAR